MTKRATFLLIETATGRIVCTFCRKWEAEMNAQPGQHVVKQ